MTGTDYEVVSAGDRFTAAVGDVHGRLDLLKPLVDDLIKRYGDIRLITLGDYVDRGPDSVGVIDYLLELRDEVDLVPLMGNHEEMMLGALAGSYPMRSWLRDGGDATLDSYERHPEYRGSVPGRHIRFLKELALCHDDGERFFVHAGVHPDYLLEDQDPEHFLWIRTPFLTGRHQLARTVIHGHSIILDGRSTKPDQTCSCRFSRLWFGGMLTGITILRS